MNESNQEIRPEEVPEVFRFLLSIEEFKLPTGDDGLLQITMREDTSVISCSENAK
jgi:hypothetical protein